MIEVNLENKAVDIIINLISTIIGIAASSLVGGMFDPMISQHTGVTRCALEAGRLGMETVVLYKVASTMSDEFREDIGYYNKIASEINAGRALIESSEGVNNA